MLRGCEVNEEEPFELIQSDFQDSPSSEKSKLHKRTYTILFYVRKKEKIRKYACIYLFFSPKGT